MSDADARMYAQGRIVRVSVKHLSDAAETLASEASARCMPCASMLLYVDMQGVRTHRKIGAHQDAALADAVPLLVGHRAGAAVPPVLSRTADLQ